LNPFLSQGDFMSLSRIQIGVPDPTSKKLDLVKINRIRQH
jgi:hypothetical protein